MGYILSDDEIKTVLKAFAALEIKPTLNVNDIKKAFRHIAKRLHPDTTTDVKQKEVLERKFKDLACSRDIAVDATSIDGLLDQIVSFVNFHEQPHEPEKANFFSPRSASRPPETPRTETPFKKEQDDKFEEEWQQFVKNENAYFNILNASAASFSLVFLLGLLSLLFIVGGGLIWAVVAFMGGIVLLLTGVFSIAIPVWGWIVGIAFLIKWWLALEKCLRIFTQI